MRRNEYKNIEWGLLIVAIILSIIGVIALFSATQETGYDEFKKQIICLVISLVIMVIVTLINYETLVKLSPIFYSLTPPTFTPFAKYFWINGYITRIGTIEHTINA